MNRLFSPPAGLAALCLAQHSIRPLEESRETKDFGIAPIDRLAACGQSQLERLLEFERGAMLAAVVAELPLIHREVLSLRFEEDMKLEQIAEVAGIPVSTAKSRLSRALETLRGRLELK